MLALVSGTKIKPMANPRMIKGQNISSEPLASVMSLIQSMQRKNRLTPRVMLMRASNVPTRRLMAAIVIALAIAPGRTTMPVCWAV